MSRAPVPRRPPGSTRVLVVYGTTEGHSAKVAAAIAETLTAAGATVDLVNAADRGADPDPDGYAGCAVVASVHAGGYRSEVVDWARRHARPLNARATAFASVSLGVLQDDPKVRQDVDAIRERFLERTGWTPSLVSDVAGALMYSRYGMLERMVMKRIAAQAGGDTDTSRDYVYTDWEALGDFARRFAARLGLRGPVRRARRA